MQTPVPQSTDDRDAVLEHGAPPPYRLHLVASDDGLYVPALVRTPAGPGPFPAVICLHGGSGGEGIAYLAREVRERGLLFDRLAEAGYAVCVSEGRAEREGAYGVARDAVLDHHDVAAVFRHLRRRPEIDPARIAFFGVSHGGELQLKVASELDDDGPPPAALIPAEPAVVEYLGLRYPGRRVEAELRYNRAVADEEIDLEAALERIARIPAALPILVLGRDGDHLQGVFAKLHELLRRAGRSASWATFDHPEHTYQLGPRLEDGAYAPDAVQARTLERVLSFLDDNLKE